MRPEVGELELEPPTYVWRRNFGPPKIGRWQELDARLVPILVDRYKSDDHLL